ncbi:MAG: hypothetical protein HQL06_13855 [Nitrospirae bacterium]|nr:hypothetical protein [Nitrospirota bacterium]
MNISMFEVKMPSIFSLFRKAKSSDSTVFGRCVLSDGSKYAGEMLDGKPSGRGTLNYPDGTKYVGEFRRGVPNGRGTICYNSGEEYEGEVYDGKPGGEGILYFPSGAVYEGEFRDGKPCKRRIYNHK